MTKTFEFVESFSLKIDSYLNITELDLFDGDDPIILEGIWNVYSFIDEVLTLEKCILC